VTAKRFIVLAVVVGFSMSGVGPAEAAEKEELMTADPPKIERPAILPVLYATLGAVQAWDVYSTTAAMQAGARERNPMAAAVGGNTGSLVGLKAATTASTIFFAERLWRKNRIAAVVMLVAINSATAAVSMHNMRNAKRLQQ
jgi:hypothetical protein